MRVNIGMPVVQTDGRSVGHVISKFSGMGRFIYPWCSAGALRARSSAKKHLGNWSGIVSFVSLSLKKTVDSRQMNSVSGNTERDVSCAFYRSYVFFFIT